MIKSEWQKENNSFAWNVIVPSNTTAEISFPANSHSQIYNYGILLTDYKVIKMLNEKDVMVTIEVSSGKYNFKIENMNQ